MIEMVIQRLVLGRYLQNKIKKNQQSNCTNLMKQQQTLLLPRESPYLTNNSLALKKSMIKSGNQSNISSNQITRTLSFDNNQLRSSDQTSSPILHLQNSHQKKRFGRAGGGGGDNSQLSQSNQPFNFKLTATHDGSVNSAVANIFGSAEKYGSQKQKGEGESYHKSKMAATFENGKSQNSGVSPSHQYYTNQNYSSVLPTSSIPNINQEDVDQSPIPKGPSPYRVYSDSKSHNIERIANFHSQNPNDKINLLGNMSIQSQNFQNAQGNLSNPSPNMSLQEDFHGSFQMPQLTLNHQRSSNSQALSGMMTGGQSYLNQLLQESNFNSSSGGNPFTQSANRQTQQLINLKNRNHLSSSIQSLAGGSGGGGVMHFRKVSSSNFAQSPQTLQLINQQSSHSQSQMQHQLYQIHQNQLHQQQQQQQQLQQYSQMQPNQYHQVFSTVTGPLTLQQLQQHQSQQSYLASSAMSMNDPGKLVDGVQMKQLPPLDPKSQQLMSSLHSQSQSRQGKRTRGNTNLQRMEGSSQEAFHSLDHGNYHFSQEVFDRDFTSTSPSKGSKIIQKQTLNDQGQSIILRVNSGSQFSSKKKNSQTNMSTQLTGDNAIQPFTSFQNSNFIIGHVSSVDRPKNLESYKSQKSITKQNLNSILNDQQILNMRTQSSQGSKLKHSSLGGSNQKTQKSILVQQQARQSPYSSKNTVDLLSFQEKRHASHGNSRQKKLKSVLQSYQSPQNQNYPSQNILIHKSRQIENAMAPSQMQSRFDMNTSPISIINENHLTQNNYLIPHSQVQFLQDEISRRTFQEQMMISDHTPKNGSRGPSQMKIIKQESHNSKGQQKFGSKKKSDHQINQKNLKLNLSNLDNLQSNPNDSTEGASYAFGTLTAKSQYPQMNQLANSNLKNIKAATTKGGKKLQINMKKVQGINNFLKASQNTSQITQAAQFITTDDRRVQKYQAKAFLSNQSSENANAEFTSARIFHPSSQDHFSLGRISSSTPQHNLFQQSQRMDRKGSRNGNSHHMSSVSNDLTGRKIIPEILEHKISYDEHHHANAFPQVVTDPTQDTSLLLDNQRVSHNNQQISHQQSSLDDAAFKIHSDNLQNSIHSRVSELDLQTQINQVIFQLQEALLRARKPNISKLVKVVFEEQQQKIDSLKRSISQTQSVSPSAYQILKEDNTRQVQLILSLQQRQEKQDSDILGYKKKIETLQESLGQKDEQIIKILKEQSSSVSQDKLKKTEESLKRVTEEMGLLYEQTQDHQKEIKKLKKDLKEAQKKEKDYLSVLKNTSEFGKITESTQQLIKMAIEQQNKTNNHNQMQIQQQHQAQLQMGAIISQNASLASKIVAQISPTVPFKIEGFPAYNLQQPVHSQTIGQNLPNAVGLPMPFDLEQDTRNDGQREVKPQTEVAMDAKPLGLSKGVPKLNLKLAMKNTSNLEPDSEELRAKKLSNLSRYKANLKAEGQASAQKLLQATSSVKGQRHFNFNQSEIDNLQNPQQERQSETLSPNKDGGGGILKFGVNTASRDSQVGQGCLVSQRNTSYKTIIQSSSKNIRTIISESDKRDEEEDEINDRIEDLPNNHVAGEDGADGGQDRLFQESSTAPKLVPPMYVKKLTTNLEQLTQPKMGLDFKKLNKIRDFQDEFMDNFDDFSLSWREAIQRQRRF